MKRHFLVLFAVLLAIAIAAPAFAAVEFKYGGQFRARLESEDNVFDGTERRFMTDPFTGEVFNDGINYDDNRNFIDQRLRLYFSFIASKNLKVVVKFEVGDVTWGDNRNRLGASSGGGVGADGVAVEVKNSYVEFNIPNTPSTGIVGVQTLTLLDSWIVDDDFSAAVLLTKMDPFRVTLGYVAGQNGNVTDSTIHLKYTDPALNVDDLFLAVDYKQGPLSVSGVFFWQNAHNTAASFDPNTLNTPVAGFYGPTGSINFLNPDPVLFPAGVYAVRDNNLYDLGFNVTYKLDWISAYVNFVKNLGSVDVAFVETDIANPFVGQAYPFVSLDYTGWMIDAGITYFCAPWTFNIGGFYTTGPEFTNDPAQLPSGEYASAYALTNNEVSWFTYPLATSKYFSEIIGGGILGDDRYAYRGYGDAGLTQTTMDNVYWRGYGFPTNLWTVTVGASYQLTPQTKLSGSYWYFGTAESVPVRFNAATGLFDMSSSIGHELDFYLDHNITDGLILTLVGAYLIADDAFAPVPTKNSLMYQDNFADNAYELGARLQWNF